MSLLSSPHGYSPTSPSPSSPWQCCRLGDQPECLETAILNMRQLPTMPMFSPYLVYQNSINQTHIYNLSGSLMLANCRIHRDANPCGLTKCLFKKQIHVHCSVKRLVNKSCIASLDVHFSCYFASNDELIIANHVSIFHDGRPLPNFASFSHIGLFSVESVRFKPKFELCLEQKTNYVHNIIENSLILFHLFRFWLLPCGLRSFLQTKSFSLYCL